MPKIDSTRCSSSSTRRAGLRRGGGAGRRAGATLGDVGGEVVDPAGEEGGQAGDGAAHQLHGELRRLRHAVEHVDVHRGQLARPAGRCRGSPCRRRSRHRGGRDPRVASSSTSSPSRRTTIGTVSPGFGATWSPTSSNIVSGSPPMVRMSSPTSNPATAAAESSATLPTVHAVLSGASPPSRSASGLLPGTPSRRERDEQEHEGLEQVHDRSGGHDQQPLRIRLLAVGAGLVLGRHVGLEVAHPDDADVGASRDALDAVLGLASLERPDLRSEEQEELRDLHPRPLGGEVVAELVEEDHHHDRGDHDEPAGPAEHAERDHPGQQERQLPVEADDLARARAAWVPRRASRLVSVTG